MRLSGATPPLPPAAGHARSTRPAEADAPAQAPAPAPSPPPTEPEASAETAKPHGLVRAADHSHRSDVAALRQWINHPDLRSELALPDLTAEHKGNGFAKAVAAYEAAVASATPPPATDAPPATDPPPASDPPSVGDPGAVADPALLLPEAPTNQS
jgi:hypothetical protein